MFVLGNHVSFLSISQVFKGFNSKITGDSSKIDITRGILKKFRGRWEESIIWIIEEMTLSIPLYLLGSNE